MGTYLNRTPSSAGNRGIWTVSCWVKKSNPTHRTVLFGTPGSDNNSTMQFILHQDSGVRFGVNTFNVFTTTNTFVMRDPASWYHLVLSINTSEGSSDNRTKFYINGERFTNFDGNNLNSITNGFQYGWNNTIAHTIGAEPTPADYMDGYITNFVNIDGQALGPSSFGETDSTTGEWKPKADLSGLTFGTNGFWQKYESAGNLGLDSSGNSNTYTVNNAGTNAQTKDTGDNNFCTMNPLVAFEGSNSPNNIPDYSKGNTVATASNGTTRFAMSTMATTMPYYFEVKVLSTSSTDTSQRVGVIDESAFGAPATYSSVYRGDGSITATGESNNTGNQTLSTNSIIGIAVDLATNNNIKYYHNGTLQATMAVGAAYRSLATSPFARLVDATQSFSFNFGNPSYTISSGNSDANGHGNFEYAVPSGYYALCTKNLAAYGG